MPSPMLQTNYILTDGTFSSEAYLEHHGIKGQKWGVRRYQNEDGTWTAAGKARRNSNVDPYDYYNVGKHHKKFLKAIEDYNYYRQKKIESQNEFVSNAKTNPEYRKYVDDTIDDYARFCDEQGYGVYDKVKKEYTDEFINGDNWIAYEAYDRYSSSGNNEATKISQALDRAHNALFKESENLAARLISEKGSKPFDDLEAGLRKEVGEEYFNKHRDVMGMTDEKKVKWLARYIRDDERMYHSNQFSPNNYLMHHGIKGQKWGIRRFQNPDGTLTELGKKRYGTVENLNNRMTLKKQAKLEKAASDEQLSAEEQAAKLEIEKRNAIELGDADRILALRGSMSTAELNEAVQRMRVLDDISKYSKETETASEKAAARQARQQNIKSAFELGKSIAETLGNKYKAISAEAARDQVKAKARSNKYDLKSKKADIKEAKRNDRKKIHETLFGQKIKDTVGGKKEKKEKKDDKPEPSKKESNSKDTLSSHLSKLMGSVNNEPSTSAGKEVASKLFSNSRSDLSAAAKYGSVVSNPQNSYRSFAGIQPISKLWEQPSTRIGKYVYRDLSHIDAINSHDDDKYKWS